MHAHPHHAYNCASVKIHIKRRHICMPVCLQTHTHTHIFTLMQTSNAGNLRQTYSARWLIKYLEDLISKMISHMTWSFERLPISLYDLQIRTWTYEERIPTLKTTGKSPKERKSILQREGIEQVPRRRRRPGGSGVEGPPSQSRFWISLQVRFKGHGILDEWAASGTRLMKILSLRGLP